MATRKVGVQREQVRDFSFDLEIIEPQERAAQIEAGTVEVNDEQFTVYRLTCSSEFPVERYDYRAGETYLEILSHEARAIDLSRFKAGAALMSSHYGEQVGVIEGCEVLPTRKLQIDVRYDKDELSQKFEQGVRRRIRRNVSIRYVTVGKPKLGLDEATGMPTRTFTRWQPVHAAHEGDPADYKVGFGRGRDPQRESEEMEVEVEAPESTATREKESSAMTEEEKKAQEAAERAQREAAVSAAVGARNTEVKNITKLARSMNVPQEKIDDMIERGIGLATAAEEIAVLGATPPKAAPQRSALEEAGPDERRKLRKHYSLVRALDCAGVLRSGGKPTGYEAEWDARLRAASGGSVGEGRFLIPYRTYTDEDAEERAWQRQRLLRTMGSNIVGAGAELVYDAQPMDIEDALRPRVILEALGANWMVGMKGDIPMPRFTSDAVLHHVDENPSVDVASTAVGTDVKYLKGKQLAGMLPYSKKLALTANFGVEMFLRSMIGKAAAVQINRGCFHGTGSEFQPMGLWNLPGVNPIQVAAADGLIAYPDFVDMITAITDADADSDGSSGGFAVTTGIAGYCRKTLEFAAAGSTKMWTGGRWNGELAGERAFAANVLRRDLGDDADEHAGLFSPAWDAYNVALFGDAMEILLDPFTLAGKQQNVLHIYMLYDGGTALPEAFSKLLGAKVKKAA